MVAFLEMNFFQGRRLRQYAAPLRKPCAILVCSDLDLQYNQALSRLEDVDYAEAVSNLTQQRTFLQAAQQSFLKVSNLSLFNYLG